MLQQGAALFWFIFNFCSSGIGIEYWNTGTKVNCFKHKLAAAIGWTGFHAHDALVVTDSFGPFGPQAFQLTKPSLIAFTPG